MPIYEFRCLKYHKKFSCLVLDLKNYQIKNIICAHCSSKKVSRIISQALVCKSEKQRLKDLYLSSSQSNDYYQDPNNIGLWAKKKAKAMGVDLGDVFDEKVEKARSGKILDDV